MRPRTTKAPSKHAKKPAAKNAAMSVDTDAATVLALFPRPPPGPVADAASLPKRGQPGAWEDELAVLPDEPAAPSIVGTHWSNARHEFWRFEPGGAMTFGLSGGLFSATWIQKASWLFIVVSPGVEILARIERDVIAGYQRIVSGVSTVVYRRADGAVIDEYVRSKRAFTAWLLGPRDQPQPADPSWPPRASRGRAGASAAAPPLRFANHRAARAFADMSDAEQRHLASHAVTIAEQAEFGGIEAIDLLDGSKVAYHLYWWPFTDGILVDDASGEAVADLLDGSLAIVDPAMRTRVEAAYRAGRADGAVPRTLTITFR